MKKSEFVRLMQIAREVEEINNHSLEKLIKIVESSFSAIATSNPKEALNIIEQLNQQKENIQDVLNEREDNTEEFIRNTVAAMPSMIEFEDEEYNEGMN